MLDAEGEVGDARMDGVVVGCGAGGSAGAAGRGMGGCDLLRSTNSDLISCGLDIVGRCWVARSRVGEKH